ncbi:DUF1302 family protein [Candidatus Omnitrophota bacterium]
MMKRLCIGLICMFTLIGAQEAFAETVISDFLEELIPLEKLELAGYFKNETSVKFASFDRAMKIKNIADLKGNYEFTDWFHMFVEFNFFYDHVYDVEGRYRTLVVEEKNAKLRMPEKLQWLREAYFDIYTPKVDMRIGKQQVVWGTTDGVRILDMVNPLDYREWTIKDYSEIRIPLWMGKFETELTPNGTLQFLVIPDYEPNYYAPAGSPFALRTVVIGAEAANQDFITVSTINEYPERTVENTKYGVRWRDIIEEGPFSGLEYTLNYLHTYDFASSAYSTTNLVRPFPLLLRVNLRRQAEQIEVFGGSFSKSITKGVPGLEELTRGWTIRGEYAYIMNGAMNFGTDRTIQGTVDVDQHKWAIGLDKTAFTNWDFSVQFIQLIADSTETYNEVLYGLLFGPTRGPLDETESLVTLRIATDFAHERVRPEILVIYADDKDWRISPKVNFEINDNWMFTTGIHIFDGNPQYLNGQFEDNDQIFFETKYSW